jgi:hypothetical protein
LPEFKITRPPLSSNPIYATTPRGTHIRRILRQLLHFLLEYPPVFAMGESSNIDVTPSMTGVLGRIRLVHENCASAQGCRPQPYWSCNAALQFDGMTGTTPPTGDQLYIVPDLPIRRWSNGGFLAQRRFRKSTLFKLIKLKTSS